MINWYMYKDGWWNEHDPSVCALNLLKFSLTIPSLPNYLNTSVEGDALSSIDGLFDTARLWLFDKVTCYHALISDEVHHEYLRWKLASGFHKPIINHELPGASYASSYIKFRAALDSYPIDAGMQLQGFFENRSGDVRSLPQPPPSCCFLLQTSSKHQEGKIDK